MAKELASFLSGRIAGSECPRDADEPESREEVCVVVELFPEELTLLGKSVGVFVHSSYEGAEVLFKRVEAVSEGGVDADELGLERVGLGCERVQEVFESVEAAQQAGRAIGRGDERGEMSHDDFIAATARA